MWTLDQLKAKKLDRHPVYRQFLNPSDMCVMCECKFMGEPGEFCTFESTAHGEAKCSVCEYPAKILKFAGNLVLQYHPDALWDDDIQPATLSC